MFTMEGAMKRLLIIIPFVMGAAACVPVYGGYVPPTGYPAPPARAVYQPQPGLPRGPIGRWDNVMMLAAGSPIAVVTNEGRLTLGNVMAATNTFLRLVSRDGELEIPRERVVRVDLMHGGRSTIARDALAGGALGVGAVGLMGLAGGRMPPARLFAAAAIFAGYESAQWGRQVDARSSLTIYLSPPRQD
jgi:hypothetical protein